MELKEIESAIEGVLFAAVDRVVEMVPDVIDKVTGFIEKQQDKDKSQG